MIKKPVLKYCIYLIAAVPVFLDKYLVGFLIFAEISEMLKKNRLEKLVFPVK